MIYLTKRFKILFSILIVSTLVLSGCAQGGGDQTNQKQTIIFADAGWQSIRLHNHIAGIILKEGYGYNMKTTSGSTAATFLGLRQGDIDVYMEVWTQNIQDIYNEAIESGDVEKLSVNFDDNKQGFYVPTYMIKGDPDRGIKPMAPDLKSVQDLPKYKNLFKDPSDPNKGRIIGAPTGWEVDAILEKKVTTYNLAKDFNYFRPGSESAMNTSLSKAYEAGEPWVGYNYEPSWIMGKYDMTLLEEPAYNEQTWNKNYGTAFPVMDVNVAVNKDLLETAPKVVEFLKKYKTNSDLTNEGLAYMQDNDATEEEAARWWLQQHKDIWTKWLPEDIAKKVEAAL